MGLVVVKFYNFAHLILVRFSDYFSFSLYFNLRFPLLGGFFSELLIFNFSFNFGNLILILILILSFGLPIIFTFQILIYTFKFSSFSFNYFDSFVCNFYNFRFLILSILLTYSVFI